MKIKFVPLPSTISVYNYYPASWIMVSSLPLKSPGLSDELYDYFSPERAFLEPLSDLFGRENRDRDVQTEDFGGRWKGCY